MKYNSIIKKVSILILAVMALMLIATSFNTVVFAEEIKKEVEKPQLNTKIQFHGETFYFANLKGRVRKDYGRVENAGEGIVTSVTKNRDGKQVVYVFGEGWLDAENIDTIEKYIEITVAPKDKSATLKINGEYSNFETTNSAIVEVNENGVITAKGNGTTNITYNKKNEKGEVEKVEAFATVTNGNLTINIPEKTVKAELPKDNKIDIANGKLVIEPKGLVTAGITVEKNDKIILGGAGDGYIKVKTEKDEANEPLAEIALSKASGQVTIEKGKATATASGEANIKVKGTEVVKGELVDTGATVEIEERKGITGNINSGANITLLNKLIMKLTSNAGAGINKENGLTGNAGGNATIGTTEKEDIASAGGKVDAALKGTDLTANANGNVTVLDKKVEGNVNVKQDVNITKDGNTTLNVNADILGKPVNVPTINIPLYKLMREAISALTATTVVAK